MLFQITIISLIVFITIFTIIKVYNKNENIHDNYEYIDLNWDMDEIF